MDTEFFDRLPPQRHPDPDRAESLVRRFNAEVQPGASIRIWMGIRGNGEGHVTAVEAPGAFVLGGVAVAKCLDGGSVALTHIEVIR